MTGKQAPYRVTPTPADAVVSLDIPAALLSRARRLRVWIEGEGGAPIHTVTWTRNEAGDWTPLVQGVQS